MGEGSSAGVKNIKKVFRHPDGYGVSKRWWAGESAPVPFKEEA